MMLVATEENVTRFKCSEEDWLDLRCTKLLESLHSGEGARLGHSLNNESRPPPPL